MLSKWLLENVPNLCTFNTVLSPAKLDKKPEFSALANQRICDLKVQVTGIQKTGEASRAVEYTVTFIKKKEPFKQFLASMDALEQRLAKLPAKNIGTVGAVTFIDPASTVYTDPVDGQKFVANYNHNQPIQATDAWQMNQELRKMIDKDLPFDPIENGRAEFSLYDDGWRIKGIR